MEAMNDTALDAYLDATANLVRLVVLHDQAGAALRGQTQGKAKKGQTPQTYEMNAYLALLENISRDLRYALEHGCPMGLIQGHLARCPNAMVLDIMELS